MNHAMSSFHDDRIRWSILGEIDHKREVISKEKDKNLVASVILGGGCVAVLGAIIGIISKDYPTYVLNLRNKPSSLRMSY